MAASGRAVSGGRPGPGCSCVEARGREEGTLAPGLSRDRSDFWVPELGRPSKIARLTERGSNISADITQPTPHYQRDDLAQESFRKLRVFLG